MKTCSKCKVEKLEGEFYSHIGGRDGLDSRCKTCVKNEASQFYKENREKGRLRQKKWRLENSEKASQADKNWRLENPLKKKRALAEWGRKNRAKINRYRRHRYHDDPVFKITHTLRAACQRIFCGATKPARTLKLLGMELKEFRIYIQGQFCPGMTWENQGSVWHLDHVRPLASFDLLDSEQQKLACHWENFQPLFAEENLKKGAKYGNPL